MSGSLPGFIPLQFSLGAFYTESRISSLGGSGPSQKSGTWQRIVPKFQNLEKGGSVRFSTSQREQLFLDVLCEGWKNIL